MPIRRAPQQEEPEITPLWSMPSAPSDHPKPRSKLTLNDKVPERLFGKDHWTTFAYIETRLVDYRTYIIACDARMRTDMHNRRIFEYRPGNLRSQRRFANAMIGNHAENGSRLRDGTVIPNHDDWCCLQDLANAGYIVGDALRYPLRGIAVRRGISKADRAELAEFFRKQMDPTGLDVGARLKFTPRGFQVAAALREHKARGGTFATFKPPRRPPGGGTGGKNGKAASRGKTASGA